MSPIAKALSPDDLAEVAAYYANASAPFLPLKAGDQTLIKRGEQLATFGDEFKHGPGGVGEPPMIPYLAGQYAHYTAFELQMWKRGYRKNSPEVMLQIAKKLDDQDIQAVAAYFQQVLSSSRVATMPNLQRDGMHRRISGSSRHEQCPSCFQETWEGRPIRWSASTTTSSA